MPVVGVRELKIHASEIVRRVRDERLEYVVTFHGRPVGLLIPIDREMVEAGTVSAARAAAQEAMSEMLSARRRERTRAAPEAEDWGPYGRAATPRPAPEPEAREVASAAPPAASVPEAKPKEEPPAPPAVPPEPEEKQTARPRPRRNWAPWAR